MTPFGWCSYHFSARSNCYKPIWATLACRLFYSFCASLSDLDSSHSLNSRTCDMDSDLSFSPADWCPSESFFYRFSFQGVYPVCLHNVGWSIFNCSSLRPIVTTLSFDCNDLIFCSNQSLNKFKNLSDWSSLIPFCSAKSSMILLGLTPYDFTLQRKPSGYERFKMKLMHTCYIYICYIFTVYYICSERTCSHLAE